MLSEKVNILRKKGPIYIFKCGFINILVLIALYHL